MISKKNIVAEDVNKRRMFIMFARKGVKHTQVKRAFLSAFVSNHSKGPKL